MNEVFVSFENVTNLSFLSNTVYSINLSPGSYLLEVWGSSGGDTLGSANKSVPSLGGRGGYSRGILDLSESYTIFAFVGGSGTSHTTDSPANSAGGFNGGGDSIGRSTGGGGGSGGGGSTDICTIKSEFTNEGGYRNRSFESYQSRIIVAGGGGGSWSGYGNWNQRFTNYGGFGGGITSSGSGYGQSYGCGLITCNLLNQGDTASQSYNYVTGSSQTNTGASGCGSGSNTYLNGAQPGSFGYGGNAIKSGSNSGGGGGGGWFGGYSGASGDNSRGTGGSGGSGYVHNGTNPHSNLGSSFILRDSLLIDGSSNIPCPTSSCTSEVGHHGDGYARITLISKTYNHHNNSSCFLSHNPFSFIILIVFMLIESINS